MGLLPAATATQEDEGASKLVQPGGFDPDPGSFVDIPDNSVADVVGISDDVVEALAARRGQDTAEVRSQLETHAALAGVKDLLRGRYAASFSGMWAEQRPFQVVFAFTAASDERLREIQDLYDVPPESVTVRTFARTLAELEGYRDRIRAAAKSRVDGLESLQNAPFYLELDERYNRLVLSVDVSLQADVLRSEVSLVFGEAVQVVAAPLPTLQREAVTIRGGSSAMNSCTIGFVVRKNNSIEAGLVTAGHCTGVSNISGLPIPLLRVNVDNDADVAWRSLAERDLVPVNQQITGNEIWNLSTITGRWGLSILYVGLPVCKYGATTALTCGDITSLVGYQGGKMFRTDYYSDGGDSGSNVFPPSSPNVAIGLHIGRIGPGTEDDERLVTSISEFEDLFGIRVATSSLPTPFFDWFLRNSNAQGSATTVWEWAESGSTPVTGRWSTSVPGFQDRPGLFKSGRWDLEGMGRFYYGTSGDLPVAGDWDKDSIDEVGVYRNGVFYRRGSSSIPYGNPGDLPLVGDWDGDGDDEVGVYRPSEAKFYLRNSSGSTTSFYYGAFNDKPVVGDWDRDNVDEVGVFRPSTGQWFLQGISGFYYGSPGDLPLPGDWDGDGRDTVGVVR